MTSFGPYRRTEATPALIRAGYPVSSAATWKQVESGSDWLNAGGAVLIPGSSGNASLSELSAGGTGVWHWRSYTRAQAVQRVWVLNLACRAGEIATCTVQAGSGATSTTIPVTDGSTSLGAPIYYIEPLGAQTAGLVDLALTIVATGGHVKLVNVQCYEQPRGQLAASSTDNGLDRTTLFAGARVYAGSGAAAYGSVAGCLKALNAADARRTGLFQWSVPISAPAHRSGAYIAINTLGSPLLARKIANGATKSPKVFWSAYAKVGAASGDVQIVTSHSGVTDSVNVTGAAFAWTTPRQILIDCEDLSTTDGRQGGAWDELVVSIRGNSATISVAAVSVFEEP